MRPIPVVGFRSVSTIAKLAFAYLVRAFFNDVLISCIQARDTGWGAQHCFSSSHMMRMELVVLELVAL